MDAARERSRERKRSSVWPAIGVIFVLSGLGGAGYWWVEKHGGLASLFGTGESSGEEPGPATGTTSAGQASEPAAPAPPPTISASPSPVPPEPSPAQATTEPPPAPPPPAAQPVAPAAVAQPSAVAPPAKPGTPEREPSLLPDMPGRKPAPSAAPPATATVPELAAKPSVPGEGKMWEASQRVLESFLAAPSWRERLPYVQVPAKSEAAMAAYYASNPDGPWTPTRIAAIESAPAPDKRYRVFLYQVSFEDVPQGFPVVIEETPEGPRVDWRSFAEFKDGHFKKFLETPSQVEGTFQLMLSKAHYFDTNVPDAARKACFSVRAPIEGHMGFAFVDKADTYILPRLEEKVNWGTVAHYLVKLRWKQAPTGQRYLEIRDVLAESWRADKDPRLGKN